MDTKKSSDKKIELKDILLREFDGEEDDSEDFSKDEFNNIWQNLKKDDET